MKQITWTTVYKPVNWFKPTPINYKLAVDDGSERLNTSMQKFGFAGSLIANLDGTIINGNSRHKKLKAQGETKIKVDVPSRKLTPKEVQEFAAIFDFARAGEVDLAGIKKDYGTTKGFFKMWGLDMPSEAIKNINELEKAKIKPNGKGPAKKQIEPVTSKPLTLVFSSIEHGEFISIAESMYEKFKTDNITDLALKVFRFAKKNITHIKIGSK